MTIDQITQLISAATGVCTFVLAVFIALQASRIHTKTDELVVHTNSLTDRPMQKTDTLARAEGVKEGRMLNPPHDPALVAAAILDAAAEKLAVKLAEAMKAGR